MASVRFGYACLTQGVPGTELRACTARTATAERLREVTAHNLAALGRTVDYNARAGIHLFRISSDLIPFGSSPVNFLPWWEEFAEEFAALGRKIAGAGLRVSMHPGQYTVLSSPEEDVVRRGTEDLAYHERILHLLGIGRTGKLILHLGGVYGDKAAACDRFCRNWEHLSDAVRSRVVLENDDRSYQIADVLRVAERLGIPAVFDTLHHTVNPPEEGGSLPFWISECARTWGPEDGRQKIHYSQQNPTGKPGAHSRTIDLEEFLPFYETIRNRQLDVMLEVKDKNLSAIKCMTATSGAQTAVPLEREWERYRYSVLERAPESEPQVRALLEGKDGFPALAFYGIVDRAMAAPVDWEAAAAVALRIWEAFRETAALEERARFFALVDRCRRGSISPAPLKRFLLELARRYQRAELLESYYFL